MANNYSDELKLRALGLMSTGAEPKDLVNELDVAYPTLLKWRRELKESIETGSITSLIDVDAVLVKETVENLKKSLTDLAPEQAIAIEGELEPLTKGVDGYQKLSVKLQTVALNLATKIGDMADETENLSSTDIETLVASLAKLQEAFFNKNGTYIQVLQNNGSGGSEAVSRFKSLQKA